MNIRNSITAGRWSPCFQVRGLKMIAYGASIVLLGIVLLSGGAADLAQKGNTVLDMRHMGYPPHFVTLLGLWKILGSIVLLSNRYNRLREWAYAGIFFLFTSTALAHILCSDPFESMLWPSLLALVTLASRLLQPTPSEN